MHLTFLSYYKKYSFFFFDIWNIYIFYFAYTEFFFISTALIFCMLLYITPTNPCNFFSYYYLRKVVNASNICNKFKYMKKFILINYFILKIVFSCHVFYHIKKYWLLFYILHFFSYFHGNIFLFRLFLFFMLSPIIKENKTSLIRANKIHIWI